MRPVFEREMTAIVGRLAIGNILGDSLSALIVVSGIPVLTVPAAVQIVGTVRTGIRSCHFNSVKIYFLSTFETKVMAFFYFWNVH